MRITTGVKATMLGASAALLLTACATEGEAGAAASATATATAEAPNVSQIVEDVRTATGCESWAGGRMAGEGVIVGWQYTCDVDGDGVADSTLSVYETESDLVEDLPAVEAADEAAAIVKGDRFLVATINGDHLAGLTGAGMETVREIA